MMRNTQENDGLEVYRKMSRRGLIRTAGHDRGRLVQLITPDQEILKLDYFTRLDKWEDKVAEYEADRPELEAQGIYYRPLTFSAYGRPHPDTTAIMTTIAQRAARRRGPLRVKNF